MSATVTLTVVRGTFGGKAYVFTAPTPCTIGRSANCYLQLPNEPECLDVSRHHCLLDIDPPMIRVRDLGSRNGTYVNGRNIGQRARCQASDEKEAMNSSDYPLRQGDEIRVGNTIFRITVTSWEEPAAARTEVDFSL